MHIVQSSFTKAHAEKGTCWKKLGSLGRKWFVKNFIFYHWIDVGWHLEFISTLEECHSTCFCQNNDPLDMKNYIERLKYGI